jgi:CheY-like chemotaxis protein
VLAHTIVVCGLNAMKIFLSSTYQDLIEHRTKAAQAIERLGQHGIRMEVFGARPGEATLVCLDEIDSSDVFVGMYAHRYGYIPRDSEVSITEQEFELAQEKHKPTFCFFIDENHPWLPSQIETEPGQSKLKIFKERVSQIVVRDTFTTPEDLAYKVSTALGRFLLASKIKSELESDPAGRDVSTAQGRDQVSRRAARLESIIRGSRVLLVNDVPSEMRVVIAILRDLAIEVDVATTSDAALVKLGESTFDAVISDIRRGQIPDEGLRFFAQMRQSNLHRPTIFTAGDYDPDRGTPPHAFGITNRVDECLNLLFDILERVRG